MTVLALLLSSALAQIDSGSSGCVTLDLDVDGRTVGQLLVVEAHATPPRGYAAGTESWSWREGSAWPERFVVVDRGHGCVAIDTVTDRSTHGAFDTVLQRTPAVTDGYEVTEQGVPVAWLDPASMSWWGARPGLIGTSLRFEAADLSEGLAYGLRR